MRGTVKPRAMYPYVIPVIVHKDVKGVTHRSVGMITCPCKPDFLMDINGEPVYV